MATQFSLDLARIRAASGALFAVAFAAALLAALPNARAADPAPVDVGLSLGLGSAGKATLLGIEGKGSKFVYVFDRSGSMGVPQNKPLNRAKAELLRSIDALTDLQQFYIIYYNQDQKMFQIDPTGRRIIWANETNKKAAHQWVDNIAAGGATRHADALKLALRLHPDVIFMLTDGDPPDDITADELKQLDRLDGGATVINVIQISPPDAEHDNLLVQLAKHSGGEHVYVDFNKPAQSTDALAAPAK
jgi:Mg-chelatase subunit ChlD